MLMIACHPQACHLMQVELFVRMIEENPAIKTAARVFAARPSKDSTKETSVVALSARPGVTHATAVRGLEPGLLTSYALWEKVAQYFFYYGCHCVLQRCYPTGYVPGLGDVNECLAFPNVCNNGRCKNTRGGFDCRCNQVFNFNFNRRM